MKMLQESRWSLGNGLQVSLLALDSPFVHLTLTLPWGSVSEGASEYGFHSLLSTLMLRGCGELNRPEFARDCDHRGASLNIYPGREFLGLELWLVPSDLDWGLRTLRKVICEPRLEPGEIDQALDEHLAQLLARKDEKRAILTDRLREEFYPPGDCYARPLLGVSDVLSRAGKESLESFHRGLFRHAGGAICMSGGFDLASARRSIESEFSDLAFAEERKLSPLVPHSPKNKKLIVPFPVEQAEVLVVLPALPRMHRDYGLQKFCNEILGGAFLSRLTRTIRMKAGMAYSAHSSVRAGLRGGSLWIALQTDKRRVAEALSTVRACVDELRREAVPEEEFRHFKDFVGSSLAFDYDSVASLGSRRMEDLMFGDPWRIEDRLSRFEKKIRPEECHRFFSEMMQAEKALVCVLGQDIAVQDLDAFSDPGKENTREKLSVFDVQEPAYCEASSELLFENDQASLYRLDNGLSLLSLPRPELASISLQIWTKTGSMDEKVGKTGLSHLLEHLMFRGTDRYPDGQYDAILAQRGGMNNAFTTEDFTVFTSYLPKDGLDDALALEADRFRNLAITEEVFQTERSVVMEERAVRVDCSPLGMAYEALQDLALRGHPYGHPVIGWKRDLESLTLADVNHHYRRAADTQHLMVVVAGACSGPEALRYVKRHFSGDDWVSSKPKSEPAWPELAECSVVPPLEKKHITLSERSGYSYLLSCYRFPREGHPDFEACELLTRALGEGDSSKLYDTFVREKAEVQEVWTNYEYQTRDHSLFHIGMAKPGGPILERVREELCEYLANVAETLTEQDLEKSRRLYLAETAFETDDLEDWSLVIAGQVMLMDWEQVWQARQRFEKVSLSQLKDVARRYLRTEACVQLSLEGNPEATTVEA